MMQAVVLAGGRGTRLRERVADLPKPMAPVAGRPFLEYLLGWLARCGVRRVVLSVGYKAEVIEAHFGAHWNGVALAYAHEDQPLGTGGAIAHAVSGAGDAPVLVLNGDTLLRVDCAALVNWYAREPAPVAMVLRQVDDVARYGAVMFDGDRVTGFTEKGGAGPGLINAGAYVVQPAVFERFGLSGAFGFETDLLQRHCAELRPRAYVTDAYFIDIGIPDDFDRAQRELPALE